MGSSCVGTKVYEGSNTLRSTYIRDSLEEQAEDLERRRGRNEISSTPSHLCVSSPFSTALNAPVPLDTRCGDIPAFVYLMWFSFSRFYQLTLSVKCNHKADVSRPPLSKCLTFFLQLFGSGGRFEGPSERWVMREGLILMKRPLSDVCCEALSHLSVF